MNINNENVGDELAILKNSLTHTISFITEFSQNTQKVVAFIIALLFRFHFLKSEHI